MKTWELHNWNSTSLIPLATFTSSEDIPNLSEIQSAIPFANLADAYFESAQAEDGEISFTLYEHQEDEEPSYLIQEQLAVYTALLEEAHTGGEEEGEKGEAEHLRDTIQGLLEQEKALEDDIKELAQYERNLRQAIAPLDAFIQRQQQLLRRLRGQIEQVEKKRLQLEALKTPIASIAPAKRGRPVTTSKDPFEAIKGMSLDQIADLIKALGGI